MEIDPPLLCRQNPPNLPIPLSSSPLQISLSLSLSLPLLPSQIDPRPPAPPSLPNFYLAGGLLNLGMSWHQSIATIFAGTTILLLPLILTSSIGVRYGVPFPVLLRASFGVRGAHVPALLRALVATGWAGIESFIAGQALALLFPFDTSAWYSRRLPSLATSPLELACFLLVSLAQLAVLHHGMPLIRLLQRYSAPVLVALTAWLFAWAYLKAGGLAGMLAGGGAGGGAATFWPVFLPSLTASVSCWSGVALNIPDFTRHAKSQAGQVSKVGHLS